MATTTKISSGAIMSEYDSVKDTFPISTAGTGTVSVLSRKVVGTSTTFTTDFRNGDFIWLKDNDEVMRVEFVLSDTELTLEMDATTDASTTYSIVPRIGFNSVSYLVDDIGGVNINGINIPANSSESFSTNRTFHPLLIDSTGNSNVVVVTAKSK